MAKWQETIDETVLEIAQRSSDVVEIKPEHVLTRDLGFASLDYAEVVATLEMLLEADPFASDVSITSIQTVQDLYNAYEKYLGSTEK